MALEQRRPVDDGKLERRPYTPPTLVAYGDAVSLTKSGSGGKNDKGSGASTRTQ